MDIGNRLKELRKKLGLTQKELAKRVPGGINYTYIGKIERGEQKPSLKILEKISQALAVPLSYFFQEETPVDLTSLLPEDLRKIAQDHKKRTFFKAVAQLKEEDIPLVTEIINVLHKYHQAREAGHIVPPAKPRGRPKMTPLSIGHDLAAEKKLEYQKRKE